MKDREESAQNSRSVSGVILSLAGLLKELSLFFSVIVNYWKEDIVEFNSL